MRSRWMPASRAGAKGSSVTRRGYVLTHSPRAAFGRHRPSRCSKSSPARCSAGCLCGYDETRMTLARPAPVFERQLVPDRARRLSVAGLELSGELDTAASQARSDQGLRSREGSIRIDAIDDGRRAVVKQVSLGDAVAAPLEELVGKSLERLARASDPEAQGQMLRRAACVARPSRGIRTSVRCVARCGVEVRCNRLIRIQRDLAAARTRARSAPA